MILDTSTPDSKRSPLESGGSGGFPDAEDPNNELRLNPGAPARKPRSVGRCCLWTIVTILLVVAGIFVYRFMSALLYAFRHPHNQMYFEGKDEDVKDWSMVVQPMIKEKDLFDVVATVWIRDDDALVTNVGEEGGDGVAGGLWIDREARPEKVLFSDTVFRNLNLKTKHEFVNVELDIPTAHFKQANISNYDLRASFVLVQQNPSWLSRIQKYITWQPFSLHPPPARQWKDNKPPTLKDEIDDSFAITIPLIQFHNISTTSPDVIDESITLTSPEPTESVDNEADDDWNEDDDKDDLLEEMKKEESQRHHADDLLDIYRLDFTGNSHVGEKHPFIVSRTHLGIVRETHLFKRQPYMFAQKELANKTCKSTKPRWYDCERMYYTHGQFETRVHLQGRSDGPGTKKGNRQKPLEYLYAPHMTAVKRSAGPRDLVKVPVDRAALVDPISPSNSTDNESLKVRWKLSFHVTNPGNHIFQSFWNRAISFNMTAPENEQEWAQHEHDSDLGVFGFRVDDTSHPRRATVLSVTSVFLTVLSWCLMNHYWYTRSSTAGISRLGTTLTALFSILQAHDMMLQDVLNPEAKGSLISRFPISYFILMILPVVQLKAVSRLEFGWSMRGEGEKRRSGWTPRIYFAKPTHVERTSERIEAKISKRAKFLFLVGFFAIAHFFAGPTTYFLSPRVQPPPPKPHPLHTVSSLFTTFESHIHSLEVTFELGGMILQLIMNAYCRTYAGNYKSVTVMLFISQIMRLMELLPMVVGTSAKLGGVLAHEVLGFLVAAVDLVQAVRYRNVKASEMDGEE